ncbi:MAG TPA: HAMP domain-containing sensor histidine kinase [Methyloceanibacter sp.]|nr:HAMP domain-containing sensor histidine kinase [Methyloceanibacter sp.]
MSSLPLHKPDLKLGRHTEKADPDREALEHIARALESRRFQRPADGEARTESEEASELHFAPQNVKALLEDMPIAAGIIAGGTLVHANSAFANAFGYPSAAELIEAGGLGAILGDGKVRMRGGSEPVAQVEALTRSRRRVKVAFASSVLDAGRKVTLLRLIDPPVSENEAETPQASPAQAPPKPEPAPRPHADAAGSRLDFLAKVSHEVRTPLNSIIGFAELMLQERFGPIGSRRYKGYVEDIHQSGLYALSLLNDLLDISKIEAGKFELNFTAVDVAEVVEECAASLQPLAKRARILLRTSLAPDLPTVVADPRRLKQILLNLLTNAIKFTNEGGQVIMSGSMVEGELRLRVRDNGVGMTKDEIAFAMQPFNQLDTAPRKQTGTGLGLPVTKALVDANRARLVLQSEPGIGTSADVIFPAERLFTGG